MNRRTFIKSTGLVAAFPYIPKTLAAQTQKSSTANNLKTEILIAGGSMGGVAAALTAARAGFNVILTEESDWIGGQLTSQAVPPDENKQIETFGASESYQRFRSLVRNAYKTYYPLTEEARQREELDPGDGSVSRLCHEPKVALAVLEQMLAPYVSAGKLSILTNTVPTAAAVNGDSVSAVSFLDKNTNRNLTIEARYFLDATETGDLLPLTKTEYVTGAESQAQTNEPNAGAIYQPQNMQAFTWCFAMDHIEGANLVIDKPAQYDFWKNYIPNVSPPWPGKLLNMTYSHPSTLKPHLGTFWPSTDADPRGGQFWIYRRIINKRNFQPGTYKSDVTIVNWPQNDYMPGSIIDVPEEEKQKHLEGAKQLSLSLFYWLQTEAPRPDGGNGFAGLRLRGDLTGSTDGLAKMPYIRESRRIKALFTVLEQHLSPEARMKATGLSRKEVRAKQFDDTVGIGYYRMDLHPSCGGDNYIDNSCLHFQIPLGALICKRVKNLIPACKNIGTTHITNGAYRLHPVEWNIGESAGALAAFCLQTNKLPLEVREKKPLLSDFQNQLKKTGVRLDWGELYG